MRRVPEAAVVLLAAAAVGTVATLAHRRQRATELSPYPGVENPGPRGLAALHAWLTETGRAPLVLSSPGDRPPRGAVLVLAAPLNEIEAADAEALLGHAARGGLLVWAMGAEGSQPELERRLQASRPRSLRPAPLEAPALPIAPHPLLAGLSLRGGGDSVASRLPGALPVAGVVDGATLFATAVSVPWGRGEVLLLESTELLQNSRLALADNLELWARLAARGPVAFDERFLLPRTGASPPSRRALAALLAQGSWRRSASSGPAGGAWARSARRPRRARPAPPPTTWPRWPPATAAPAPSPASPRRPGGGCAGSCGGAPACPPPSPTARPRCAWGSAAPRRRGGSCGRRRCAPRRLRAVRSGSSPWCGPPPRWRPRWL